MEAATGMAPIVWTLRTPTSYRARSMSHRTEASASTDTYRAKSIAVLSAIAFAASVQATVASNKP
jgi:hypothetical protein